MNRKVYIDGNLLVKKGIFYAQNIVMGVDEMFKTNVDEIICPPNGLLEITEDYGSIFTVYYIKGGCTFYGGEDGFIYMFETKHEVTCDKYKQNIKLIEKLINEVEVPEDLKNAYYQQQYVSVFGALEYFLFDTFMGQVCSTYDIYIKVLSNHVKYLEYSREIKKILRGKHNLEQEKMFIAQSKEVIYHNTKQVAALFSVAFDMSVNLEILNKQIEVRNDIVHRFGHTKKGDEIHMTKGNVVSLIVKTDILVNDISKRITEFIEGVAE